MAEAAFFAELPWANGKNDPAICSPGRFIRRDKTKKIGFAESQNSGLPNVFS
jgi:hypothetical protein